MLLDDLDFADDNVLLGSDSKCAKCGVYVLLLWTCLVVVVVVVNVKAVSILLAVLAAVVLGHGIADVLYTVLVICSNTSSAGLSICPLGENLAILFTWIGASVWCSIFVSLFILFRFGQIIIRIVSEIWRVIV